MYRGMYIVPASYFLFSKLIYIYIMSSPEPLYTPSFHIICIQCSPFFVIYCNRVQNIFTYIQFQLLVAMVVLYIKCKIAGKLVVSRSLNIQLLCLLYILSSYREAHVKKGVAVICLEKFNAEFHIQFCLGSLIYRQYCWAMTADIGLYVMIS